MGIGEELERLSQLHGEGHLTDDEFTAAKAKLLAEGPPARQTAGPRPSVVPATSAGRNPRAPVGKSPSASKFAAWTLAAAGLFGVLFLGGSSDAPSWCNSLQEFVRADTAALAREGTECLARAENYRSIVAVVGLGVVGLAATTLLLHRRDRASWNPVSGSAMAAAVAVVIGVVSVFSMVGAGNEAVFARYSPGEDYADSEGGGLQPVYQAPRQETHAERRRRDAIECQAAGPEYRFVIETGQCVWDPY